MTNASLYQTIFTDATLLSISSEFGKSDEWWANDRKNVFLSLEIAETAESVSHCQ